MAANELKTAMFSLARMFRAEFEKRNLNFQVLEDVIYDRRQTGNEYRVKINSKHETEEIENEEGTEIIIWICKVKKTNWKNSRGKRTSTQFETLDYYGSVNFNVVDNEGKNKTLTFDRLGVELSLSGSDLCDKIYTIKEIFDEAFIKVLGYLDTIKDRRNEYKNRVQVPGTSFSLNKDKIEEIKSKIKAGGYSFEPSGFGYAIRFTTKLSRRAYGVREATPEQKVFFGFDKLYVERSERD